MKADDRPLTGDRTGRPPAPPAYSTPPMEGRGGIKAFILLRKSWLGKFGQ
jgi:hypothetical protein